MFLCRFCCLIFLLQLCTLRRSCSSTWPTLRTWSAPTARPAPALRLLPRTALHLLSLINLFRRALYLLYKWRACFVSPADWPELPAHQVEPRGQEGEQRSAHQPFLLTWKAFSESKMMMCLIHDRVLISRNLYWGTVFSFKSKIFKGGWCFRRLNCIFTRVQLAALIDVWINVYVTTVKGFLWFSLQLPCCWKKIHFIGQQLEANLVISFCFVDEIIQIVA